MPQNNKPGRRLLRQLYGSWYRVRHNISIFVRWCLFAVIIGVVVGAVGAAFEHALEWATETRQEYSWTLYFLPLVGLFIAFWYSKMDMPLERGTNFILTSVRQDHPVRLRLAPSIFITSVLTHLCGGSAGREGAALQLGGAISGNIGHLMHLDDKDSRTITMCGMAACFSALFGTPLAASVFAMEVISVGVMYYAALFPSILASVIAHQVALQLGGGTTAFTLSGVPENTDVLLIVKLVAFGVVCAGLSALVCIIFHKIGHLFKHFLPNQYACIAVGGAVVVLISLLLGTRDYNGAGMQVIERAIAGHAAYETFFLKLVLTAITIGVGYKGGEIVPTLTVGAAFGYAVALVTGLPVGLCASAGMACLFVSVTNCPVSTMFMAFELFGFSAMPYYSIAVAVCFTLSGYYGLYHSQKFVYSKIRTEFINRKSNE